MVIQPKHEAAVIVAACGNPIDCCEGAEEDGGVFSHVHRGFRSRLPSAPEYLTSFLVRSRQGFNGLLNRSSAMKVHHYDSLTAISSIPCNMGCTLYLRPQRLTSALSL